MNETKNLSVRIEDEVKKKLLTLARMERRTMSTEIVYLIEKRFDEIAKSSPDVKT